MNEVSRALFDGIERVTDRLITVLGLENDHNQRRKLTTTITTALAEAGEEIHELAPNRQEAPQTQHQLGLPS